MRKTLEEEEVIEVNNKKNDSNCYYYGKPRHMVKNYYQNEHGA